MFAKIKNWFGLIFSDRQIRLIFAISGIISVLLWVFLAVRFWPLIVANKIVGLHYSIYIGLDDIGPARRVLYVPAAATVILLVNAVLTRFVGIKNRAAAFMIAVVTLFLAAMCLIAGGYLILINLKT